MTDFLIRPTKVADAPWIDEFTVEHSLAPFVVAHGESFYPRELLGFVAEANARKIGFVSYYVDGPQCEIVTLDSVVENEGVGTALIGAVVNEARAASCERVWLITTNDNVHAIGFYQKRGFDLVAVRRNALEQSRRIKPQIPSVGMNGIPLRDEIEFELRLQTDLP